MKIRQRTNAQHDRTAPITDGPADAGDAADPSLILERFTLGLTLGDPRAATREEPPLHLGFEPPTGREAIEPKRNPAEEAFAGLLDTAGVGGCCCC